MSSLSRINARDFIAAAGVHQVPRYRRTSPWWVISLLLVLVVYAPALRSDPSGVALVQLPWILAAYLATVAWATTAVRASARAQLAFWAFAAAALFGMSAKILRAHTAPASLLDGGTAVAFVLPNLALALGAYLALGSRRNRIWSYGLAADATLLLLVAVAVVLRLLVEPVLAAGPATPVTTVLAIGKSAAILPLVLGALILLRRGGLLSPWAATLLLLASAAFAIGDFAALSRFDGARPMALVPVAGRFELAGWLLLAGAGFHARRGPATAPAMLALRRVPDILRRLVVPGAALFLAVVVVDMAVGRDPRPETVTAVAALAVVFAARSARVFRIADRESERVREITYTRALVDVTHALAGTTDLDATLRIISDSARAVFATRGAGIELIAEDGRSLETRSVVGLPENVIGLRFPIEGSFTGWAVRHGEPRATVDPSSDPFIQPQSLRFLGHSPVAAAPIQFRGQTLGALFACNRSEPFDAEELELLGAMAEQAAIAIHQARLFEQVTILSVTDPLTGLANRRQLQRELAREFAAAQRGRRLAVVIFDLDQFKEYNDSHGHLAGDRALVAFAESLKAETRTMNVAARYGGDEFVSTLGDAGREGARIFVERVRVRFEKAIEELGHGPLHVSAGVAEYESGMEDAEALLRAADAELYREKPRASA